MNEKPKYNLHKRLASSFNKVLKSSYTRTILGFLCFIALIFCLVFMHRFYNEITILKNQLEDHGEYLVILESRFLERTVVLEQNIQSDISRTAGGTRQAINVLDTSYQDLLTAQNRKTVDNLYRVAVLDDETKEAIEAFKAGRYVTASRLYRDILIAQPDNQEARFYQYYSLFLSNKQDRNNYRAIRDAFNLLKSHGYARQEINDTLEFIAIETNVNGVKP